MAAMAPTTRYPLENLSFSKLIKIAESNKDDTELVDRIYKLVSPIIDKLSSQEVGVSKNPSFGDLVRVAVLFPDTGLVNQIYELVRPRIVKLRSQDVGVAGHPSLCNLVNVAGLFSLDRELVDRIYELVESTMQYITSLEYGSLDLRADAVVASRKFARILGEALNKPGKKQNMSATSKKIEDVYRNLLDSLYEKELEEVSKLEEACRSKSSKYKLSNYRRVQVHCSKSNDFFRIKDGKLAEEELEKAEKIVKNLPAEDEMACGIALELAKTCIDQGKNEKALDYLKRAIREIQHSAKALWHSKYRLIGECLIKLGKTAVAKGYLAESLKNLFETELGLDLYSKSRAIIQVVHSYVEIGENSQAWNILHALKLFLKKTHEQKNKQEALRELAHAYIEINALEEAEEIWGLIDWAPYKDRIAIAIAEAYLRRNNAAGIDHDTDDTKEDPVDISRFLNSITAQELLPAIERLRAGLLSGRAIEEMGIPYHKIPDYRGSILLGVFYSI